MKKQPHQEKALLLKQKEQLEITLLKLNQDLSDVIQEIEEVGLTENQRMQLSGVLKEYDIDSFEFNIADYSFNHKDTRLVESYYKNKASYNDVSIIASTSKSPSQKFKQTFKQNYFGNVVLYSSFFVVLIYGFYEFVFGAINYGLFFITLPLVLMSLLSYLFISSH